MKYPTVLAIAIPILSLCIPAAAHPGHAAAPQEKAYLVSWIGVLPASNATLNPASCPDFYKRAFVSKYAILGSSEFK